MCLVCLPCIRRKIGSSVFIGVIYRTIAQCFFLILGKEFCPVVLASILRPKIARQLTPGEFIATKPIQPESSGCFVSTDGKDLIESASEF